MSIDWDSLVLAPVMGVFGEGIPADQSTWPIYTPAGGAPFALPDAVFDRAYAEIVIDGEGSEATSRKPCLGVRLAHFTEARGGPPKQDGTVYIPSVPGTFVVKDVQPDGHGHAKLILMGPTA